MSTISLQELEGDPLAYFHRVEAGESILVTRDNRPVVELRPVASPRSTPRPYGLAAGEFTVPDDFDAPRPEEILKSYPVGILPATERAGE
jgi:antitoxin (DNA-binding transcriptional repressor) of toxin-antitoxin stability system